MLLFLTPPPQRGLGLLLETLKGGGGEIVRIYGWVPHRANYNFPPPCRRFTSVFCNSFEPLCFDSFHMPLEHELGHLELKIELNPEILALLSCSTNGSTEINRKLEQPKGKGR